MNHVLSWPPHWGLLKYWILQAAVRSSLQPYRCTQRLRKMGSNLRRCENETAILLLATSQRPSKPVGQQYTASSWLWVRMCYANPASETCSRGPKHSSRQHKTSALATVEIKNRRGGGSKYLHFEWFCVCQKGFCAGTTTRKELRVLFAKSILRRSGSSFF